MDTTRAPVNYSTDRNITVVYRTYMNVGVHRCMYDGRTIKLRFKSMHRTYRYSGRQTMQIAYILSCIHSVVRSIHFVRLARAGVSSAKRLCRIVVLQYFSILSIVLTPPAV